MPNANILYVAGGRCAGSEGKGASDLDARSTTERMVGGLT